MRPFTQVDVFVSQGISGNPVAVVHDAVGLSTEEMQTFARWTNLSETTFVLPPTQPGADYRLRLFTPNRELPFAGHPTLGSAHAWMERGGQPAQSGVVVQECGVGLVTIRVSSEGLAFAAPPLRRSGAVDEATLQRVAGILRIPVSEIVASNWADNGPPWLGVLLRSADDVLALEPDLGALQDPSLAIGVIGPHAPGGPADYEVRAFIEGFEDPVTGSLNASLAMWLLKEGRVPLSYKARQGTAMKRAGHISITTDADGQVWVQGRCNSIIQGATTI